MVQYTLKETAGRRRERRIAARPKSLISGPLSCSCATERSFLPDNGAIQEQFSHSHGAYGQEDQCRTTSWPVVKQSEASFAGPENINLGEGATYVRWYRPGVENYNPLPQLHAWYREAFCAMYQTVCKRLAKIWIKAIHPKKSSGFPYERQTDKNSIESLAPGWWPEDVEHKGPDRIKEESRVRFLMYILLEMYDKTSHGGEKICVDLLRAATDKERTVIEAEKPNGKLSWQILDHLYVLREDEEVYIKGGKAERTLGETWEFILWRLKKPVPGVQAKRKCQDQNSGTKKRKMKGLQQELISASNEETDMMDEDPMFGGCLGSYEGVNNASWPEHEGLLCHCGEYLAQGLHMDPSPHLSWPMDYTTSQSTCTGGSDWHPVNEHQPTQDLGYHDPFHQQPYSTCVYDYEGPVEGFDETWTSAQIEPPSQGFRNFPTHLSGDPAHELQGSGLGESSSPMVKSSFTSAYYIPGPAFPDSYGNMM